MKRPPALPPPLAAAPARAERGQGDTVDGARYRELLDHYGVLFGVVEGLYQYMVNYPMADLVRAGLDRSRLPQGDHPPRLPAERFMFEWLQGTLPVPLQVCTAEQLYRAFLRRWLEEGGGRAPPTQVSFTKTAVRWCCAGSRQLARYKIINLSAGEGRRRSTRCWLPIDAEPADGRTEGEWAADQTEAFEASLERYLPKAVPAGSTE